MAWRCVVCGYIHEGLEPPEICPVCGAGSEDFEQVAESAAPAAARPAPAGAAPRRLVVVGAGIAGLSAAEAARAAAPDAEITLLSAESDWPYYRLNLTRLLAGEIREDQLPIHPPAWYDEQRIDLRRGRKAVELQPADRRLILDQGDKLDFDRLVLAAGATAFVPPLPGADLQATGVLRSLAHAQHLLLEARKGGRIVILGGGILGLEAAAGLAKSGAEVLLLESADWLLPRQLNRRAGERLAKTAAKAGVTVFAGVKADRLDGGSAVKSVRLADGIALPADLVLFTTGVRSDLTLARQAGLSVQRGVLTDDLLATSHPDIFAAGDVAEHRGVVYGLWEPAQFQGQIAGGNAAGKSMLFGGIPPSNTLKVMHTKLFSIGQIHPDGDGFRMLESETENTYLLFVLRAHRLTGAILLGDTQLAAATKTAIERQLDTSAAEGTAEELAAWLKAL